MKIISPLIWLALLLIPMFGRAANVTLTASDTLGQTSFNSNLHWSDASAPSGGNNYFTANFILRTPPDINSYAFGGGSLTVNNNNGYSQGLLYKGSGSSGTITIPNLILAGGFISHASGVGDVFKLAGNLNVTTNSTIYPKQGAILLNCPISGSSTITNFGADTPSCTLTIANPTNTFTGSIVNNGYLQLSAGANLNFVFGASNVNNHFTTAPGVIATFSGRFVFDLSNASTNLGSKWYVASSTNQGYGGTFNLDGFTRQGFGTGAGVWNLSTNGVYYEFNTTNGFLTVVAGISSNVVGSLPLTTTKFDGVEADVALSYSPDAASRQGGEDNIQVNLANAIAGANAAHKRSGTGVRLRIAGFYMSTNNPVSQDNNYVLSLVNSDAAYQDVRDFGVATGADLVSFYSYSTGAAGNAYQPGMYSSMCEQWIYYLVVAHELGHNYGCAHQDGRISPKTVMMHNYCGGGAQGYFSNPQMWINGTQMIGDGDTCLSVAQISGGDNANRLAGAAIGVGDNRARIFSGPNLTNVVLRWLFTNAPSLVAAGTTNFDLVSNAPAVIRGNNAVYTGSALRIPGGTTGNVAMNTMSAYIDLPNGIISSRTNITIEIWATPQSAPSWARLLDFGRATQAGDGLGAAGEYTGASGGAAPGSTSSSDDIMLSAVVGTDINAQRFEAKLDGVAATLDAGLATTAGVPHHYAITFTDGAGAAGSLGGRWQWFRDGDPIAFLDVSNHLASIEDVNNWLGRSMWSDDAMANNDYTEVRISSVAMSRGDVLANFLLGPNYSANTTVALNSSDTSGTSSFNAAGQWNNAAAPSVANSYETFDYLLRTPATGSSYTFGASTLKISGGELLYKSTGGSTITVTNLQLNGGVVHHSGSGTFTLAGNVSVSTNSAEFFAQNGAMTVTAPISGLAPVYFLGNTVTLSGNNTNLLGKVMIGNGVAGAVQIDSEARLGPLPAAFNPDQLTLNRGTLLTTTSMTLSNTTRGILLDVSGGTFNVASGTTLTLASKLSSPSLGASVIAGSLGKAGAGTLILSTTNPTFYGSLYADSGSTTANDGVVKIINNQVLANARSPIYLRNNSGAAAGSTLQLDGAATNLALSQGVSLFGRNSSIPAIQNLAGTNTISGGLSITVGGANYWIQSDAGLLNFGGTITSAATGARTITFLGNGNHNVTGTITDGSATVSLVKSGIGVLTLGGANTFTGPTAVNAGSLFLNGSLGNGTITVANGATLGGNGTANGALNVNFGGTLTPGTSIGQLTINNLVSIANGSITRMEISKSPLTNDALVVTGTLNFGGTLVVTNLAGPLAGGDSFQLFNATSFTGSFTATNLPTLTAGLAWSFNAENGMLRVVSTASTNLAVTPAANAFSLSWPADRIGWRLQSQTNSLGTNWFTVPGSMATNLMLIPFSSENENVFFRLIFP